MGLRWYFFTAIFLIAEAHAETAFARVEAVHPGEQQLTVAYLRSDRRRPSVLRGAGTLLDELKAGELIRLEMAQYEGLWWIDAWWPVAPEAARMLAEDRSWMAGKKSEAELPMRFLGLDPAGRLVDLKSHRFLHGCFLVPYVRPAEGSLPAALASIQQFAKRLATTPHRDLPVVLWSLEPEFDHIAQIERWRAVLGEAAKDFIWVSGLREWQERWREHFALVLFRVEGQPTVTNPLILVLDGDGNEIVRYEGANWAEDWLVSELDEAFLGKPR